jgi:hypothetical protein
MRLSGMLIELRIRSRPQERSHSGPGDVSANLSRPRPAVLAEGRPTEPWRDRSDQAPSRLRPGRALARLLGVLELSGRILGARAELLLQVAFSAALTARVDRADHTRAYKAHRASPCEYGQIRDHPQPVDQQQTGEGKPAAPLPGSRSFTFDEAQKLCVKASMEGWLSGTQRSHQGDAFAANGGDRRDARTEAGIVAVQDLHGDYGEQQDADQQRRT